MKKTGEILEKIQEQLDSIDKTLAVNTSSLKEHIRRTEILEDEIRPVKVHVQVVNTLAKIFAAGVAALVGLKHLGLF